MLIKSLLLCHSSDIWYDELFTVGMIEHSYGDLIAYTARDVHPPLYYCIVKIFVDLCKLVSAQTNPVVVAKVVSVLPYFGLLAYGVTFIRRRFGMFTGGLFLFSVIAMPQLSAYTVEVRMYSFALFFVTAAFCHAYGVVMAGTEAAVLQSADGDRKPADSGEQVALRHVKSRRAVPYGVHAAAFVLYGLAAAYTQYFACVAVIMVYLYVLVVFLVRDRRRIKKWFVWVAVSVVGYAPWLYTLFTQIAAVSENYWILPLGWRTFGGCVKFVMKPAFTHEILNTVLAVVLFAVCVSIFGYGARKLCRYGREKQEKRIEMQQLFFAVAGVGVLVGLVLFGYVASMLLRPIFVYRYMIPALGCFWLGFAVMLDQIGDMRVSRIVFGAVAGLMLLIGLRDYRAFMGEEEYKIRLMQETEAALSSIAAEDIVLYNFDQVQAVTSYYLDRVTDSYLWCGTPETLIQEIVRPYESVEETAQLRAWVAEGRTVWFLGSFNSREDIVDEWEAAGLRVEETGSYLLERYWFNLYRIF